MAAPGTVADALDRYAERMNRVMAQGQKRREKYKGMDLENAPGQKKETERLTERAPKFGQVFRKINAQYGSDPAVQPLWSGGRRACPGWPCPDRHLEACATRRWMAFLNPEVSMKRMLVVLACALMVCAIGCEDEGDGGGSGVSGTWTGSGAYVQGTPISNFTLVLTQSGNAVSGSYDIARSGRHMAGSVSGTVSANALNLTLTPHGRADGTVSGNTMSLHWWESGFGGDPEGKDAHVTLTRQ